MRTLAHTMETAKELGVPESRYEFQVLYGMAEPVRKGLKNVASRVRLYCPYGELIPGMAFWCVDFWKIQPTNPSSQSFAENEIDRLMENPD